jgi:hypothetical protein
MWIFKAKTSPSCQVEKLKARIVVKGNEHAIGIDFSETFAPIVRWSTIRSIISIAARKKWRLQYLDVITTFLHGLLTEEVYMIIPPGFPNAGQVCKLVRTLYGLKQASRAWYTRIDTFYLTLDFKEVLRILTYIFLLKTTSIQSCYSMLTTLFSQEMMMLQSLILNAQ